VGETTGVVFDLDDTLYPELRFSLSGYAAVAAAVAAETGMPAAVLYRFLVGRFRRHGREGLLQALCLAFALPTTDVPRLVEIIRTHTPRLRLPRRTFEVLRELRARGHRLAILTNGLPGTQRGKVKALGVEALVDVVVYAQEHAPGGKPAPVCFSAALRRLEVDPARAVFVGDHPEKDIAGAVAAGLHPIWMPGRRTDPCPASAHAVARSLAEVPGLVARLLEERHVTPC
jgi:putative hydrolase of the HAD superfamily